MPDVHSKKTRSYNMSRIRSTDTKPEMVVRKFLHGKGFRYRLHDKTVFGKPDMVFKKLNTVLFVHGCYFHRHKNCKYASLPKSNVAFWKKKFEGNIKRDALVKQTLKKQGWKVIVVWECTLKPKKVNKTLQQLAERMQNIRQ